MLIFFHFFKFSQWPIPRNIDTYILLTHPTGQSSMIVWIWSSIRGMLGRHDKWRKWTDWPWYHWTISQPLHRKVFAWIGPEYLVSVHFSLQDSTLQQWPYKPSCIGHCSCLEQHTHGMRNIQHPGRNILPSRTQWHSSHRMIGWSLGMQIIR